MHNVLVVQFNAETNIILVLKKGPMKNISFER